VLIRGKEIVQPTRQEGRDSSAARGKWQSAISNQQSALSENMFLAFGFWLLALGQMLHRNTKSNQPQKA
jgi:hypothetical protein